MPAKRSTKTTKAKAKVAGTFDVGDRVHIGCSDRIYLVRRVDNDGVLMDREDGKRDGALCNPKDVRHEGHPWVPPVKEQEPVPAKKAPAKKVSARKAPAVTQKSTPPTATQPAPAPQKATSSLLSGTQLAKVAKSNVLPHLFIEARAGSGKTTTLVGSLFCLNGEKPKMEPSPQQAAIWNEIARSAPVSSVGFVAFNVSIAQELGRRIPNRPGYQAMTLHSLGFKAVRQAFCIREKDGVTEYKAANIAAGIIGQDPREIKKSNPILLSATSDLVGCVKQNLVGFQGAGLPLAFDDRDLWDLAKRYDIDLEDDNGRDHSAAVFPLVREVLNKCLHDVSQDGYIDYDDMIWLPIMLGLPVQRFDLLMVDESQDLNPCQQEMVLLAGKRLVFCGDPKQAIYAFAGADARSMDNLRHRLGATPAGVLTFPLTVTRRCPRAVVKEANKYVPDLEAHPSNGEGEVSREQYTNDMDGNDVPWEACYASKVKDGDMVICRVNAPLVSQCFKFLQKGRKATIRGRDIVKGLISLIDKLHPLNIDDLMEKLTVWLEKETAKEMAQKFPSEGKLMILGDKVQVIRTFAENSNTIDDLKRKFMSIFVDKVCPLCKKASEQKYKQCYSCKVDLVTPPGVTFSSIHKAKGLEAPNVYLIKTSESRIPHPMAKTDVAVEQELNLLYVAITRAMQRFVYVTD